MKVLLVNQPWPAFGGSETYLLTVGPHLQRMGHEVTVLAPAGGEPATLAEERGLPVAHDVREIEGAPDVVVCQDAASAHELAVRFPRAARVYVIHSSVFEPQRPPQLADVCHAIVALNEGMRHQAEALAAHARVVRMRQPVDLERFTDRGGRGIEARRLLMLGNHWGGPGHRNYEIITGACEQLGIEFDHVGAGGRASTTPELEIAGADIVVGIGRCVIEAMASARAAYVFGDTGGEGWVTPESYEALERTGFTGGYGTRVIDADGLRGDLERFDPDMGQVNRQLALANHDAHRHAAGLVDLFRDLEPGPPLEPHALGEIARLVRVQREISARVALAEADARRLRADNERLTVETETLSGQLESLRGELRRVLSGRRYRLAQLAGRPLDLARRHALRRRERERS